MFRANMFRWNMFRWNMFHLNMFVNELLLLFQVVNFGFALRLRGRLATVVIELCGDVFPYFLLSS